MTNFKSNLPAEFDLNKRYAPIRTEYEKERMRNLHKDPRWKKEWSKKNNQRLADPDYHTLLSEIQTELRANEELEAIRVQNMRAFWDSEEGKKFAKEKHTSDTFRKAMAARSTPEFCAKVTEGKKKPICVPWGNFPSKQDAVAYAKENGIKDPARKIEKGLKIDQENYYYKEKTNG